MSLVIAIRDKDRIVFGSDKQCSTGANKAHDTTKIWEVQEVPNTIMGGVGSMRASQIIQYGQLIDLNVLQPYEGITTSFIINELIPNIVARLQANGVACAQEDKESQCVMIPNTFLLASGDKAWMIWNDLSVSELGDYLAIGSGSDVATGALFATRGKNPFERIVTCIDAAAESTLYVDDGVDILATKYYKADEAKIYKALGVGGFEIAFTSEMGKHQDKPEEEASPAPVEEVVLKRPGLMPRQDEAEEAENEPETAESAPKRKRKSK